MEMAACFFIKQMTMKRLTNTMLLLAMMLVSMNAQAALNDLEKEMVGHFTAQSEEPGDDEHPADNPMYFTYVFDFRADKTFTIQIILDQTQEFALDISDAEQQYANTLILHAVQTIEGKWRCTSHSIILDDSGVVDRKVDVKMKNDDEIARVMLANIDKDDLVDEPLSDQTIMLRGNGAVGGKEYEVSFNEAITFLEDGAGKTLELYAEE